MTSQGLKQRAIQLVGPDRLEFTDRKPVVEPGPHQVLCRVVVVGLCFSDIKLLKQFSDHARKGEVIEGADPGILAALSSYVPGDAPTVPGHEPVVEVVRVGPGVQRFVPGERYFVQADWRWLRTEGGSNGAFGYNFEGALQEYVLMDERLLVSPDDECMLMPAPANMRAAAAFALVEPWACVEQSYQVRERTGLLEGGARLIVADTEPDAAALRAFWADQPAAGHTLWCGRAAPPDYLSAEASRRLDEVPGESFDDILYFGHDPEAVSALFDRCSAHALVLLMRGGSAFGRPVDIDAGGIHYRGWRLAGTATSDPAEAVRVIPETGHLREGDRVHVIGAGGPMGVMHVVRSLCEGVAGIEVHAADLSDERLAALGRIARPLAEANGLAFHPYNSQRDRLPIEPDYTVVMAPVPKLVEDAVTSAAPGGRINIFAGIPLGRPMALDIDACVDRGIYLFGTSGSLMEDMRIVLSKVEEGRLDTNVSVAAVSGLEGAIDGIRAVEKQAVAGKILVYPSCRGLKMTSLESLKEVAPDAAAHLRDGVWTREAEDALLEQWGR